MTPRSLAAVGWPVRSARLSLRPAEPTDADRTWPYWRRPDVSRWITVAPADVEQHRAWFAEPTRLARMLVVEHAGVVIGDLMVRVEDPYAQAEVAEQARGTQAELGWVFDPAHGGHGYATEAVRTLLPICFVDLGLRRVVAHCFADNAASVRLLERVGFRRESHTLKDSLHRSGEWLDGLGYALTADEWRTAAREAVEPADRRGEQGTPGLFQTLTVWSADDC
jgi:RimJ/RimL family protein N-acetyltransferase